ncbi:MAG: hypothetical protein QM648_07850 [Solirubrobacterales bacterium]
MALAAYARTLELDPTECDAAWCVFDVVGLPLVFPRDVARIPKRDFIELALLARVPSSTRAVHPLAHIGERGWVYVPGDAVIGLAKRIAAEHPKLIIDSIEQRENQAGHADSLGLVRSWSAGDDAKVLHRENLRLRALVGAAAVDLERAGLRARARLLRAAID